MNISDFANNSKLSKTEDEKYDPNDNSHVVIINEAGRHANV